MLDYRLDPEHEALRKTVEEFARDVVAPVIGGYYERGEFPYDIVARRWAGWDYFALCLALEAGKSSPW
jgi:hypothetical protein